MQSSFKLSRRQLLSSSIALTSLSGLTLYPHSLLSQNNEIKDHFFCFILLDGGWDVTLGIDPWLQETRLDQQEVFIEYPHSDLISRGNIFLGPAASPLKPWSDRLCIINGVFMGAVDNGHPAAVSYISTGNPTGSRPDLSIEIADCRSPLPFGVISNHSLQTKQSTTLVSTSDDLAGLIDKENPMNFFQILLSSLHNSSSDWNRTLSALVSGNAVYDQLRAQLKKMLEQYHNLQASHVVAASFASQACAEAQITLKSQSGNLDTHSQHVGNHLQIQKGLWEQVVNLFDVFQKTPFNHSNLFEHTTFMIASEFARTSTLNSAGGKDHNPLTNSVVLAGRGVRGNQVIGGSKIVTRQASPTGSSYHIALPWDYQLQRLIQNPHEGTPHMIFPENIVRTLVEILKINPNAFKSVAANTAFFPQILL